MIFRKTKNKRQEKFLIRHRNKKKHKESLSDDFFDVIQDRQEKRAFEL